ncbi:hypothetical protein I4U23_005177 [Adineta vaga]|nr:hypothetical protein I4U23_005177 [Adineta vaga]
MENSLRIRNELIQLNKQFSQVNVNEFTPEVISLFNKLTEICFSNEICLSTFDQMLQTDMEFKSVCENLRHLFALYGFYVEIRSARLCAVDKSQDLSEHFKYRQNYMQLIGSELNMLQDLHVYLNKSSTNNNNDECNTLITKIAFIGSGPIPISSIIILEDFESSIDIYNIDKCEEANQLASVICEQVLPSHLSKRMHFITQDICENPLGDEVRSILNQCQLIYLAAYVGENELEKLNILQHLVESSNDQSVRKIKQYFIIRTAEGLYQVLFPKIRPEKIAMLQTNTDEKKNLYQIEKVHRSSSSYGIVSIIVSSV